MSALDKEELIELVRQVVLAEGTEEALCECIEAVSRVVPHPSWTDLVYYDGRDLSPEEIVEEALAYRPVPL